MPTFTVDVDVSTLYRQLGEAAVPLVRQACLEIAREALPRVAELVGAALRDTPEYQSLLGGLLREEFGLAEPAPVVDSVVRAVQASVRAETLPREGDTLGGVFVGAFESDFGDAMSAAGAEYVSTNSRGEAHLVPWLKWLLFAGDAVVLTGVEILKDHANRAISVRAASRTGKAIMVRRSFEGVKGRFNRAKGRSGPSTWRVPAEFSGNESSNWLTRTAELVAPQVEALLVSAAGRLK